MKNLIPFLLLVAVCACTSKDPVFDSNIGLGAFYISQSLEACEEEAQNTWGATPEIGKNENGLYVKEYYWPSYSEPIKVIASPNDHTIYKIVCHFSGDIYAFEQTVKGFKDLFPTMPINSHSETSGDFDYIYTTLNNPANGDCITIQYSHYNGRMSMNQIFVYITNSHYSDYLNGISR